MRRASFFGKCDVVVAVVALRLADSEGDDPDDDPASEHRYREIRPDADRPDQRGMAFVDRMCSHHVGGDRIEQHASTAGQRPRGRGS
jgi:hypothetical protein